MELFGIEIKKSKKEVKLDKAVSQQRIDVPMNDDGSLTLEGDGYSMFNVYQMDMTGSPNSEISLVNKYRTMAQQSEIERAIDEVVNDAIVINEASAAVSITTDFLEVSETVSKKIQEEFQRILELLKFRARGYELFKRWYVDGRLYFHVIVDKEGSNSDGILSLDLIDAVKIRKVREVIKEKDPETSIDFIKKINDFYIYDAGSKTGYISNNSIKLTKDSVISCNSGLIDAEQKYGISYLHKAIKPLNQLRMTEDAIVIYRISRAPERRVFYIDVGSMPKAKAEQYMTSLMRQYRGKTIYDASTGEIKDDRKHMHIMEDFWLPRRDTKGGTEITTLEGGKNLGEMADVVYFEKKLYQSLSVPIARLDPKDKFSLGETGEISREELQFSRFITRLRNKFSQIFTDALKLQLILKNIIKEEEWEGIANEIRFDFLQDNFFEELKTSDILQSRMNLLDRVETYKGIYFSDNWIRKNILKQTDDEIEDIQKEIAEDTAKIEAMSADETGEDIDDQGSDDLPDDDDEYDDAPPAEEEAPTKKGKLRKRVVGDEVI